MIKLSHISKEFVSGKRTRHAVQDVSLTIDKGEIFGMIGFSGAGKSTLVRCINLLERPTSGKVIVDGQDMLSLSAKELRQARKKIGMIFQHFNLMPSRTVAGNVAYPLRGAAFPNSRSRKKYSGCLIWSASVIRRRRIPSSCPAVRNACSNRSRTGKRPECAALR